MIIEWIFVLLVCSVGRQINREANDHQYRVLLYNNAKQTVPTLDVHHLPGYLRGASDLSATEYTTGNADERTCNGCHNSADGFSNIAAMYRSTDTHNRVKRNPVNASDPMNSKNQLRADIDPDKVPTVTTQSSVHNCMDLDQYTDGAQVYWVMNGMHVKYLNTLIHDPDGPSSLLPIPASTSSSLNTKYAIEMKLFRKVTIKAIVLAMESKIQTAWFELKLEENGSWQGLIDESGQRKLFSISDSSLEFEEPHAVNGIRIYPVETNGIIRFRMPGIMECVNIS